MSGGFVLLVGPSGAGKDRVLGLVRGWLAGQAGFVFPRRAITRPPSVAEAHEPWEVAAFEAAAAGGRFCLHWGAHGLRYGIPAEAEAAARSGAVVVCNVSRAVLAEADERLPGVTVVEITAPPAVLAERLVQRGREDAADRAGRLARQGLALTRAADLTILNDGLPEVAAARLLAHLRGRAGQGVGTVIAVSRDGRHHFGKQVQPVIQLLAGLGVEGDAHAGATVKHRSRVRRDPSQPNLRQVHLIHAELHAELAAAGFALRPGEMGENITTAGLDLLGLPTGTLLRLGEAVLEVTGLRNPCAQIEAFRPGLLAAVLGRDAQGQVVRKAGIMAVVRQGGEVAPGAAIRVALPPPPHQPLAVV